MVSILCITRRGSEMYTKFFRTKIGCVKFQLNSIRIKLCNHKITAVITCNEQNWSHFIVLKWQVYCIKLHAYNKHIFVFPLSSLYNQVWLFKYFLNLDRSSQIARETKSVFYIELSLKIGKWGLKCQKMNKKGPKKVKKKSN